MRNSLVLPTRNYLNRIIDSPFNSLIDDFFNNSFPTTLIKQDSYPKYNIKRLYAEKGSEEMYDNGFVIEMALAGWSKDDFEIYTEEGTLYIASKVQENDKECKTPQDYYYQGISTRSFSWSMNLPKYAVIKDTSFENGLLSITVKIEVPEEQKRKLIEIK